MKIRKAKIQDVKTCVNIEHPLAGEYRKTIRSDLVKQIKCKDHLILVAEENHKIVGFITVSNNVWNNSFLIKRLYVKEKERSKGYGSKLLSEIIKKARQLKARIIFLDLSSKNKGAMKFYLRNGFKKAGQIKDYYMEDSKSPHAVILSYKL